MSNLIIPSAGAALGFWVGGGTGATIGWMLGSGYQQSKNDIDTNRIEDLRIQTSSYGSVIPIVNGKQRVSGNIIWATDKVPHETNQGGKGGGPEVTVTTYTISMAIAICKGPILGITRVWEDGKLRADVNGSQTKLPGTLYLGSNTQTPDSYIESIEGVGEVPAYRGLAYMVFEDFDLGADGRVPMFSFEVVKGDVL